MNAVSFLPSRFRGGQVTAHNEHPSWINKRLTPLFQTLSRLACLHPIHTVVIVALLASSTYIGLLEESLFDVSSSVRKADWSSLVEGSRMLKASPETLWKWQSIDSDTSIPVNYDHQALLTLVFPESLSSDAPLTAPMAHTVPTPQNLSITSLPTTSNPLSTYSQDSALAFSIPYNQAPEFLTAAQEIPDENPTPQVRETEHGREKKMWIMKAARVHARSSVALWLENTWTEFLDLIKNAETVDIFIMLLGYLSMHLTFVSLFLSMRRMGSNFWLGALTIFSSVFAFLFGLIVTTKLGVPISMVLLSEGLPFLVVTIGFEKNIVLTRAVLSHAIEHRKPQDKNKKTTDAGIIQYAIQAAIKEKGYDIVQDYIIEIAILVAGAASGVQGGLQQFCFLAAWILFFDCILLFSFYTAILSIKLEINRIRRHVEVRKALEDDGVSRRVAESVAKNNDEPGNFLFGRQIRSSSVPKFKVLMVTGFVIVNILNVCTIPFRNTTTMYSLSTLARGLSGVVNTPPVDPFKVASNGLDALLSTAQSQGVAVIVTILAPIKYELEYPSVHYALPVLEPSDPDYVVGGRMVGSILKSLEDPILSKWIVVALAISVSLNGYLFNAARWGIKDPNVPDHPVDRQALQKAEQFNDPGQAVLPLGEYMPPLPSLESPKKDEVPESDTPFEPRSMAELDKMLIEKRVHEMTDAEVVALSLRGKIPGYALEKNLKDCARAVRVRRSVVSRTNATAELTGCLERSKLPWQGYNYDQVLGACCENVIGYMPLPVGVAGPIVIDGQSYFLPMATTEGVLVASTSRGCKAINSGGGAVTVLTSDGMTRGPCVSFETLERAGAAKLWLDSDEGQKVMRNAFNSTSRFARLQQMKTALAGTNLYIRFKTTTGDAMGMNMISKGVEHALNVMMSEGFEDMNIVTLSGNYCTDKKPAAINWIDGRGKGVVAEAIIPAKVVKEVLKTDVDTLVDMNVSKNMIGSAMAGSIGGFNAHAANIVAALFIATGQDPAQVVESANCITIMRK